MLLALGFMLCSFVWMGTACSNTPPTAANKPVTIGATVGLGSGYSFSPLTVTINHGQSVVWNSTLAGHNVTVDNYSGTSGTCSPTTNTTTFPVTQVFSAPGTFYYHCN